MLQDLNWLVIPGGPGLSVKYMQHGLKQAFAGYNIYYYTPLGTPELLGNHIPTIEDLVAQIASIIHTNKINKLGLITHSFGNYLAMRLLEKNVYKIDALIMISPLPFTYKHYQEATQNLISSIPEKLLNKMATLMNKKYETETFELLFPYYATKTAIKLPKIPFASDMCEKISKQLTIYNDTNLLLSCKTWWACIMGQNDPFYLEKDLLCGEKVFLMPGIGHYPFYEDPQAFNQTVHAIEEKYIKDKNHS